MKHIFEDKADDIQMEDGGKAKIATISSCSTSEDLFVRIQSWREDGNHVDFDKLIGKNVKIVLDFDNKLPIVSPELEAKVKVIQDQVDLIPWKLEDILAVLQYCGRDFEGAANFAEECGRPDAAQGYQDRAEECKKARQALMTI